jgi:hypothetical protein
LVFHGRREDRKASRIAFQCPVAFVIKLRR